MSWYKILWRENGTEWLLDQWGRWSRIPECARLSYPEACNFVGLQGGSIKALQIDPDTALVVDSIVLKAGEKDPRYKDVIIGRYVMQKSLIDIARYLRTNRTGATQLLFQAEAWIDGLLHGHDAIQ